MRWMAGMILRIKVRRLKRLMARNKREAEDMLVIIKGGLPRNEPTHKDIERARAEVRAINAARKGRGRIHVIGGLCRRCWDPRWCPRRGGDDTTIRRSRVRPPPRSPVKSISYN